MSQNLILKIKGLNTNSNQLSEVEPGSLSIAKNINIDKDSVAEIRRGFDYLDNPPSFGTENDRITEYQDKLIVRRSNDDSMNYYDSGWSAYSGTYKNPDDDYARMRFLKTAGNLYFTTLEGVKVLDNYAGPIYSTGMPKGLDGVGSTTGASGFMTTNTQVAYRVVWGSKDANNNLYLGSPSQRIIVANTSGGFRDVSLTFTIPDGITVSDFYQVYRSKESASSTDEPNDELQLVYEENPTSGQISAKSVTFTDSTTNTLMGAYLYTNASQEGLSESNDIPPMSNDIALFKGFTFFANIRTKHQLNISLLSIGGTGLALNDTITIDGDVFTAKGFETISSGYFQLFTAGSAAQNIDSTARSLVKVINQYSANTAIYAYYVSEYDSLPGQILLEKRVMDQTSFTVSVSRVAAWDIDDGVSDNSEYINGLMWSKNQQAEHVPMSHLEFVGSKNYAIRRIIALRDSLFILKDDGVFRLTGSGGVWSIDPLDTSTRIIAPDSAAVINNQIFCLSDQGIVAISDIGVEVKSRKIEDQIQQLISIDYFKLKTLSFGINYDTDRKYILFTIDASSDNTPTKAFVFNIFTNQWTNWYKPARHGFISTSQDKLYLCSGITENVLEERKTFTYLDYVDEEITGFNIVSYSGDQVVIDLMTGIEIGDILYQSVTKTAIITAIDVPSKTLTMNTNITWDIASCSILKAIDSSLEFTNITNDNAGLMKHFQEIAWLFRDKSFDYGQTSFYTDLSSSYDSTTIYGDYGSDLWGGFGWGVVPWGGIVRPKPVRVFVMREKSRGSLLSIKLSIKNGYSKWSLNGMSLQFEYVSERMERS